MIIAIAIHIAVQTATPPAPPPPAQSYATQHVNRAPKRMRIRR